MLSNYRSLAISLLNMALAVWLAATLLSRLDYIRTHRAFGREEVTVIEPAPSDSAAGPRRVIIRPVPDSAAAVPADPAAQQPAPAASPAQANDPVNFYDIILLMLISGALGGVLCNLRGIFVHYREESKLPDFLFVPYLVRPFTGGICGLFIYFVASLLVTSITVEPAATGIGFQGMISYIALAIVAGFGSQEFMEKLKVLSQSLFGEREKETAARSLKQWKRLKNEGIISDADYERLKERLLAGDVPDAGLESFRGAARGAAGQGE